MNDWIGCDTATGTNCTVTTYMGVPIIENPTNLTEEELDRLEKELMRNQTLYGNAYVEIITKFKSWKERYEVK